MTPQVRTDHYFGPGYDSKGRFCSYWHQVQCIITLRPESILEVGVGNGFLSNYLRQRGFNVATMDIDANLHPDKVGSVLDIPCSDNSFDVVACYEVLEHLPFEHFGRGMREIYRVAKRYACLSLPDCSRAYRLVIQVPKVGEMKVLVPAPRLRPPVHQFEGEHYWEINKAGFPLKRIQAEIQRAGFSIIESFRVFEFPYHRFFVMEKGEIKTDEQE